MVNPTNQSGFWKYIYIEQKKLQTQDMDSNNPVKSIIQQQIVIMNERK